MNPQEKELLLSIARILKLHLSDHVNNDFKYMHDDLRSLVRALAPYESNVTAFRPDQEKNSNG